MYPGHPWEKEEFGEFEFQRRLKSGEEVDVKFDVSMGRFLAFCKETGQSPHALTMKVTARLSSLHLPQYMLALNGKTMPARYPSGYVRPIKLDRDMLEHIAIREKSDHFGERDIRQKRVNALMKWFVRHQPRLGMWLARYVFTKREGRNNYALLVSRNPLKSLNTRTVFYGANYRTMGLAIPYGKLVSCGFAAPLAFGNLNFFEPFISELVTWMEQPETIPRDVVEKPYRAVPPNW